MKYNLKEKVYIESSVISYFSSRPSRDLIVAANQEVTQEWWSEERFRYDCYVSELVLEEIGKGDIEASKQRLHIAKEMPVLVVNEEVIRVAGEIIKRARFTRNAGNDIIHIAIAIVHRMNYLLTWNCTHIANPHWQSKIFAVTRDMSLHMPVICTPQALLEGK